MFQMCVNKISTFLHIKIFIVSIGFFLSYLILECLLCLHMIFSNLATRFYTIRQHIIPWAAASRPKMQIQNMCFSVFFSAVT